MLQSAFKSKKNIQLGGNLISLAKPIVMGILNITPDSFFDGGSYISQDKALKQVQKMINEGATLIDVGSVSSRPGAQLPGEQEELDRLLPILNLIRENYPEVLLSIDTFRSGVVKRVYDRTGPFLVNDISAGEFDDEMFQTICDLGLPYCMMHMQQKPETMQQNPQFKNVVQDIIKYFASKIEKLKLLGANDVIIDPGFGFGKTLEHNFELLAKLDHFKIFELPVMIGVSRKSMIYKTLETTPGSALNGTSVLHGLALDRGANILRVHDVKEAVECIQLLEMIKGRK